MIRYDLTMILAGTTMLAASLKPVSAILRTVSGGRLHRMWRALRLLITLFMAGYATFGTLRLSEPATVADFVVSAILLAGDAFVPTGAYFSYAG